MLHQVKTHYSCTLLFLMYVLLAIQIYHLSCTYMSLHPLNCHARWPHPHQLCLNSMPANTQVFHHTPHNNFTTSTHALIYTTTTTLLSVLSILTCLELAITWPAAAFNLTTQAATTDLHLHMYTTFKPHPLHTPHMLTHHILVHLSGCSWVCPQNGTLLAARS